MIRNFVISPMFGPFEFKELENFADEIKEANYDYEKLKLRYWNWDKKPRTKAEIKEREEDVKYYINQSIERIRSLDYKFVYKRGYDFYLDYDTQTPYKLSLNLKFSESASGTKLKQQKKILTQVLKAIKKMEEYPEIQLQKRLESEAKARIRKIESEKTKKDKLEIIEFNKNKSLIDLKYSEGLEFVKNKKFPNAIFSFSEAIKLDDFNKYDEDLYIQRGNAKFEVGDFLGCITDMDKSINLKGNSTIKLFNKGLAQFNLKKFNEALNSFNELLELDASYKEALFYRGLAKISLEQKEEGCLDLSRAGELGFFKAYDEIKKYCT